MNSVIHITFLIIFAFQILKSTQFSTGGFNCKTPDGASGTCVEIHECEPIHNYLKESNYIFTKKLQQLLKEYTCGYIGQQLKVCCSKAPIINSILSDHNLTPNSIHQTFNNFVHKNAKLFPLECGINKNQNVKPLDTKASLSKINGQEATLNEFPWMALLSYSTGKETVFRCVGTIINERYILTTANCISKELHSVRVGEHNTAETRDCERDDFNILKCSPPAKDISIEKAFRHEEFQNSFTRNDIGLIRLSKPLNIYSENVRAICLPLQNSSAKIIDVPPISLTLTGWGVTKSSFKNNVLLKENVSTMPQNNCSDAYQKASYNPMLSDKQFCIAGQPNGKKILCGGDVGSPSQMLNGIRYTQYGIVSISQLSCLKKPVPYINTRVDRYIDWILDNIEP